MYKQCHTQDASPYYELSSKSRKTYWPKRTKKIHLQLLSNQPERPLARTPMKVSKRVTPDELLPGGWNMPCETTPYTYSSPHPYTHPYPHQKFHPPQRLDTTDNPNIESSINRYN